MSPPCAPLRHVLCGMQRGLFQSQHLANPSTAHQLDLLTHPPLQIKAYLQQRLAPAAPPAAESGSTAAGSSGDDADPSSSGGGGSRALAAAAIVQRLLEETCMQQSDIKLAIRKAGSQLTKGKVSWVLGHEAYSRVARRRRRAADLQLCHCGPYH